MTPTRRTALGPGLHIVVAAGLILLSACQAVATMPLRETAEAPSAEARFARALARYEAIVSAGGWEPVAAGPKLDVGVVDDRVRQIGRRLKATGDLPASWTESRQFHLALEGAVRRFQRRHGLAVDGVVGPETRAAMNVSAEARIATLRLNLTRLRAADERPRDYIEINAPTFELHAVRGGETRLRAPVIVGKPRTPTPEVVGTITRIVFNPYWNVPKSIARNEMAPRVRRDPGYLARQGIQVLSGWGPDAKRLDPRRIDWSSPAARRLRFRQVPGARNALGRVKFLFDNPYSVYLHDTPAKKLFARHVRAFSHGCIRVAEPIALARLLLSGQSGWSPEAVDAAIRSGRNQVVTLAQPIPVHVVYRTAWVEEDGTVQFRRDLYGRDRSAAAKTQPGPGCGPAEG